MVKLMNNLKLVLVILLTLFISFAIILPVVQIAASIFIAALTIFVLYTLCKHLTINKKDK